MVPLNRDIQVNIPLIAGIPLRSSNHNMTSNCECDGSKIEYIGQSAAKLPISTEERSETIRKE